MKMTIDRVEGDIAVLVTCEENPQTVNLPLSLLPPGSREGDVITVEIGRDDEATRETKNRVRDLIAKLKNKR
jgi:hypothetical protein